MLQIQRPLPVDENRPMLSLVIAPLARSVPPSSLLPILGCYVSSGPLVLLKIMCKSAGSKTLLSTKTYIICPHLFHSTVL